MRVPSFPSLRARLRVPESDQSPHRERVEGGRTLRSWILGLFPDDQAPSPRGRWAIVAGLAFVAVGAVVSLGRVGAGPGVLQTIWAEDGTYFLSDALNGPVLETIFSPVQGYYLVVPRLAAIPASLVPLEWAPAVLSIEAAILTALLALVVYVASRSHLPTVLGRLVAAAPVVMVPVGENVAAATANNVATLQFPALYAAMWALVWTPATRLARLSAVAFVLGTAVSTFLSVLLLPLALLRLYARRDRLSVLMVGALAAGAVMNLAALTFGLTARPGFMVPRYEPVWALESIYRYSLPYAMFGYRLADDDGFLEGYPDLIAAAAAAILIAVVVFAALRMRPNWLLATVILAQAALLYCAAVMSSGGLILRYVVAPELMLFAAMAVLLSTRTGSRMGDHARRGIPIAVLALFVTLVSASSYSMVTARTLQRHSWASLVGKARIVCQDPTHEAVYVYPTQNGHIEPILRGTPLPEFPPNGWPVKLPCDRLR